MYEISSWKHSWKQRKRQNNEKNNNQKNSKLKKNKIVIFFKKIELLI